MTRAAPEYIWFTMLNQGGGRRVHLAEIPDEMIEIVRPYIGRDGVHLFTLPTIEGEIAVHSRGNALLVTVRSQGQVLARIGVAGRGLVSNALWSTLHEERLDDYRTTGTAPPQAPWVALGLARSLGGAPREAVYSMIVLAKSVAWCWVT